jgi:hypothetical protein
MSSKYEEPELTAYGPVHSLTGALGTDSQSDQSDKPNQFPPDGGSSDVCNNDDPDSVC